MAPNTSAPVRTSGELEERLRRRLRVTSVIWATATAVLATTTVLARSAQISADPLTFWTEPPLPGVLFLISLLTVIVAWLLSPGRALGLRRLRAVEWFGAATIALFLVTTQTRAMETMLPGLLFRPMELGVAQGAPWGVVIVAYGVLIPSSLRHFAARTAALAACAFLPELLLMPGYSAPIRQVESYIALKAIVIAVMSALAGYGSYRILELGQDVAAARELGQYVLSRMLGQGGMGSVYLAEHRLLRRPCAVKLIRADQASDGNARARFEREVQCAAALTHPNTVQIYDYGQSEDGTFYFAMEYLPGISLEDFVERHGPMEPARAVQVMAQLCGALNEAHSSGLVHRDIKPGNVMLCERGGMKDVAKLLDFGLVGALQRESADSRITEQGMIIGTPSFMSPEQCMGESDVGPASDLYSLGAVGYFLLAGIPPLEKSTTMKTIVANLNEEPRPVSALRPTVPDGLSAVIARCLAKKPADRFPDARSLEQALVSSVDAGTWTDDDARAWWGMHGTPPAADSATSGQLAEAPGPISAPRA